MYTTIIITYDMQNQEISTCFKENCCHLLPIPTLIQPPLPTEPLVSLTELYSTGHKHITKHK